MEIEIGESRQSPNPPISNLQSPNLPISRGRSSILYAMGITQRTNGTDLVLALANLSMLCGQIGKPSTGVNRCATVQRAGRGDPGRAAQRAARLPAGHRRDQTPDRGARLGAWTTCPVRTA